MKLSFLLASLVGTLLSGAVVEVAEAQRRTVENANGRVTTGVTRQGTGANGGTATSVGGATRNPNTGQIRGGRATSATGANGGSVQGSTTYSGTPGDMSVDHSHSCTKADGSPCKK